MEAGWTVSTHWHVEWMREWRCNFWVREKQKVLWPWHLSWGLKHEHNSNRLKGRADPKQRWQDEQRCWAKHHECATMLASTCERLGSDGVERSTEAEWQEDVERGLKSTHGPQDASAEATRGRSARVFSEKSKIEQKEQCQPEAPSRSSKISGKKYWAWKLPSRHVKGGVATHRGGVASRARGTLSFEGTKVEILTLTFG